jgi:DNA-binding PadR family transcriptional regulator
MSLEHAILGFINYKPFSGYDLKKLFDSSVHHFWPADQSQIYRTLSRLSERGWASMEVVAQENRPSRKVFQITEKGKLELRQWLSAPLLPEEHRSASLIQVFFAGQLDDEQILTIFRRHAELLRGLLSVYDQVPASVEQHQHQVDSAREGFFWMLTLECGVTMARAQLEWVEGVIRRIKKGEHDSWDNAPHKEEL